MKTWVAYYSLSGNTESIARAIHDEMSKACESELRRIEELDPTDLGDGDLAFIGSPCHGGDLAAQVKGFLSSLPEPARFRAAGFVTHSSPHREDFRKCISSFEAASREKGFAFLGCYDCQGRLQPEIQPVVQAHLKMTDEEWEKEIKALARHPDKADTRKAREFARDILSRL